MMGDLPMEPSDCADIAHTLLQNEGVNTDERDGARLLVLIATEIRDAYVTGIAHAEKARTVILGELVRKHDIRAIVIQFYGGQWKAGLRMPNGMGPIFGGATVEEATAALIAHVEGWT